MSTTALTPTHHGGFIRAVASIAVAIAIPVFAPEIALSIGLTGIIGNIAASAVVGGAIGALAAKVLGSDWKMGAIGGAIGGGIGGFAKSGGFSGIGGSRIPGGSAGDFATTFGGNAPGVVSIDSAGLVTSGQGPSPFIFGGDAGGFGAEFDAFGNPNPFEGAAGGFPVNRAPGDIGARLAGEYSMPTRDFPNAMNYGSGSRSGLELPYQESFARAPVTAEPAPILAAQTAAGYDYPTQSWAASDAGAAAARASAVTPTAAAEPGFFTDFQGKLTRGLEKAFDPENLAQKGLEAAGQLALDQAAGYFADEVPVSREEEARLAFLDQQRAEQGRLQGEREKIALGFANEARSISGTGQAQSTAAKVAAARAGQTYVRQGSQAPAAVAARQRRVNLDIARRGGTAQIQGRTAGLARRTGLLTAAAGTLPTGQELASGARADLAAADTRFARMQESQKNLGYLLSPLLPSGTLSKEERDELAKKQAVI